jgi:acetyl esterase/lipase
MPASIPKHILKLVLLGIALLGAYAIAAESPPKSPNTDSRDDITLPSFRVPYSSFASPQARRQFRIMREQSRHSPSINDIAASRAYYDSINRDRVRRMKKIYPVIITARSIGGVPTDVVTPAPGVAPAQASRVLINLHGGDFLWGAHSGGLVESIPIASLGRIKVITVDYRQGPEHVFPAAGEDVETVYRALLKHYPARNIGIYGCSAGGVLTGEAVARFITRKLPVPGAIGTFCGSIVEMAGDMAYTGPILSGDGAPTPQPNGTNVSYFTDSPYFKGARRTDPMVFPGNSPALLAKFPPTLLITGSRDSTMSTMIQSQRLLTAAGVDAELQVWDGMWHSFFSDPELPESREAYAVIVNFFNRQLGR